MSDSFSPVLLRSFNRCSCERCRLRRTRGARKWLTVVSRCRLSYLNEQHAHFLSTRLTSSPLPPLQPPLSPASIITTIPPPPLPSPSPTHPPTPHSLPQLPIHPPSTHPPAHQPASPPRTHTRKDNVIRYRPTRTRAIRYCHRCRHRPGPTPATTTYAYHKIRRLTHHAT